MHHEKSGVHPGQELQGKQGVYLVEAPLGEGGFGLTFLARRKSDNLAVVLKLLRIDRAGDWKAIELFEREASVLQQLSHPNIPRYLDAFSLGDPSAPQGFALIQSLIEGRTLRQVMREGERLGPEVMFGWFWRMLEVCHYLHGLMPPVIHRDINPKNIILNSQNDAVLIDFGTVQARLSSEYSVSSTSAGTFGYAPHEQFIGRASPASDLYGLAMTFLAVATGKEPEELPFSGNQIDVRQALASAQVDARLLLVLDRMTHPDAAQRPASAKEVMGRLESLRGQGQTRPRDRDKTVFALSPSFAHCSHCQHTNTPESVFCESCGGDLGSQPSPSARAAEIPALGGVLDKGSGRQTEQHSRIKHWKRAKEHLAQIPSGTLWSTRPEIPLGRLEYVAFNDEGTYALLVAYEDCYLLDLREMRTRRLVVQAVTNLRGAFSADGRALLIADYYNKLLHFVTLSPGKEPVVRTVARPELKEHNGTYKFSVALSPDHQIAALGARCDGGALVLLIDWKSTEVSDRLPLPWDNTPRLLFSPDGSDLYCFGDEETLRFKMGGDKQGVPALHIAMSPDGKKTASLAHITHGLSITSNPPSEESRVTHLHYEEFKAEVDEPSFSPSGNLFDAIARWASAQATPPQPSRYINREVKALRFSPDGRLLGVVASWCLDSWYDQVIVIDVASGEIVARVSEPYHPERCFKDMEGLAFAEDGRLLVFARSHPSPYQTDSTMALLIFSPYPELRYLGSVQLVKRYEDDTCNVYLSGKRVSIAQAEKMGMTVAGKEEDTEKAQALARCAMPPGDPDPVLPFGETSFGFFGRLDAEQPIGAAGWMSPLEKPGALRSALLGGEEAPLLDEIDRLRRADLEARQVFWLSLQTKKRITGDLRALVDASAGLTHLLPMVLSYTEKNAQTTQRFGGSDKDASLSEALLVKACKEIAGYSEAEREVLFHQMPADLLRGELSELGIALEEYALLLMLPLFEVAWTDGKLQKKEARAITDAARERGLLGADERHPALERWSTAPPVACFTRARKLLVELAGDEDYPDITREKLAEIVQLCHEIADSSGGFLGFGRLSKDEKVALGRIEESLSTQKGKA